MMQLCPSIVRTKPCIPELDFSGCIISVGSSIPEARGLKVGMDIFGSVLVGPHISKGAGSLAEYVAVEANCVVRMPEAGGDGRMEKMEKAAGLGG
ncbi:hypothetical protein B0A49_12300 [Cryomyces minteri]|uniref:Alcohol dehydrogenase-like N-terminal domain-containing protein n=1 Tax=Cryomyces minteri TaxID=331657 RepID=A0A4U0WMX5_9PEZI|nr:hypothetical protein B0A49_12300 [Cryomyces minteri]